MNEIAKWIGIVLALLASAVSYGVTQEKVSQLEKKAESQVAVKEQQIRMEERQKIIQQGQQNIQSDVKDIKRLLQDLKQ